MKYLIGRGLHPTVVFPLPVAPNTLQQNLGTDHPQHREAGYARYERRGIFQVFQGWILSQQPAFKTIGRGLNGLALVQEQHIRVRWKGKVWRARRPCLDVLIWPGVLRDTQKTGSYVWNTPI